MPLRDGSVEPADKPHPALLNGSDTVTVDEAVAYPPLAVTRPELHAAILRYLKGDESALPDHGTHPRCHTQGHTHGAAGRADG